MHASTGCHNSSSVWFFCRTNRPFTKVPLIHRAHQRPLWQLSELLLSSMVACWDENHFHQKHGQSGDIMAICCWAQEWPHTWAIKSAAWLERLSSKQHRKARNVIHNCAYLSCFLLSGCVWVRKNDKVDDTEKINYPTVKPLAWKHITTCNCEIPERWKCLLHVLALTQVS